MHERDHLNGQIGLLKNGLLHHPYKGTISGQLQAVDKFSTLLAENIHEEGNRYRLLLARGLL